MRIDMALVNNGYTYTFSDGTQVWSREPMTRSELIEFKKYMDKHSADHEDYDDEDYEPYYTLGEPNIRL